MDIKSLLKSLNAHDVRYMVIGAFAFPYYGYTRATVDIDIFIEPSSENAARTHQALVAFGYDLADLQPEDLLKNKILIRQHVLETDIHPFVAGAVFSEVWEHRQAGKIEGEDVYFPSLDDLIKMKRAANREKDQQDLKILLKLKQQSRDSA